MEYKIKPNQMVRDLHAFVFNLQIAKSSSLQLLAPAPDPV